MNKKLITASLFVFAALVFSAQARLDFAKADKDGDGKLTKEEFVAEFKVVNPKTADKAEYWFGKNDLDGDGMITAKEFAPPKK